MRLPLILVLPLLLLNVLVDWYVCRAVRQRAKNKVWYRIALYSSLVLAAAFMIVIAVPKRGGADSGLSVLMWSLFSYLSIYIGKYIFIIIDLISKIPCLFRHKRIKSLGTAGACAGVLVFVLMWWGTVNRFNIDVEEVEFAHTSLPQVFDGFKVLQVSDIHTGTYGNDPSYLQEVVERINSLKPDVVLFTGDIVNRHSTELEPFVDVLKGINAPYGVFSVLGNHDYGDYYNWPSDSAKNADRSHLADLQKRMGWRLLNNESVKLRCGLDSIVVIGVENIGDPPFPVYGDLDKAYPALDDPSFKILMSHNPAHWVEDIKDSPDKNIPLTLSGHTHAMQIELLGVSPAALRYPTWGGMYADTDSAHHLYVNIGLGEVGFPARIGATPELTLFTLRKKQ